MPGAVLIRRRKASGIAPPYEEETALHSQGYSLVAGLDEAVRGPLPVPLLSPLVVRGSIATVRTRRSWTTRSSGGLLLVPPLSPRVARG